MDKSFNLKVQTDEASLSKTDGVFTIEPLTRGYGITLGKEPLGRRLTRSDLRRESPFNTYLIEGLPPSPIANPGSKAIEAVLHPKKSNDLYFVADGKGGHVFAETLEEHNRNASHWRNIRDKISK